MVSSIEMRREILHDFERNDLDTIMGFFAEDPLFEMPRGPEPQGIRQGGTRTFVRDWLGVSWESPTPTLVRVATGLQ